jgi:demethylmenaquinone methyltransferase/2-methoxy-6-polyprenyl-1,4-benzoquinol methylase
MRHRATLFLALASSHTHLSPLRLPEVEERRTMAQMFSAIAARYDFLNDILSLGLHRLGRRELIRALDLRPGMYLLDVCAGTGELALRAVRLGANVTLVDGCEAMLTRARRRIGAHARLAIGDALRLPFADAVFDAAMIGFAVRNVLCVRRLFEEMARVVAVGGKVACLEFTQPRGVTRILFRTYLASVVPLVGRMVDAEAYAYLARSVAQVVDAETLKRAMIHAGLQDIRVSRRVCGTMAVHVGRVAH